MLVFCSLLRLTERKVGRVNEIFHFSKGVEKILA